MFTILFDTGAKKKAMLTCKDYEALVTSDQGPVVQSVVSLTSSLRDFVNCFSVFNTHYSDIFCKSYSHFFRKKIQHICVSLDVNFNGSLTNDVVSFEQLGPVLHNLSMFKAPHSSNIDIFFF